jgi:hypothetical protein
MQRTDHAGVLVIGQSHNDLMADHCGVLGVLDPISLPTAAMDFKRTERRVFQELANLFEHGARYNAGGTDAKAEAKPAEAGEQLEPPRIERNRTRTPAPAFIKNSA